MLHHAQVVAQKNDIGLNLLYGRGFSLTRMSAIGRSFISLQKHI